MKKQTNYLPPQSDCVEINAEAFLCNSPGTLSGTRQDNLDVVNEDDMGEDW